MSDTPVFSASGAVSVAPVVIPAGSDVAGVGVEVSSEVSSSSADLIRARLSKAAAEVEVVLGELDARRRALWPTQSWELLNSASAQTPHPAVSRDIVFTDDGLLIGYQPVFAMREKVEISDVFSLHSVSDEDGNGQFEVVPYPHDVSWLSAPEFLGSFEEMMRYFKSSKIAHLQVVGEDLLAVFQISDNVKDVRVYRFNVNPLSYMGDRSKALYRRPAQFSFEWRSLTRDMYVSGDQGEFVSLDGEVFLSLRERFSVRCEDGSRRGRVVMQEDVVEVSQSIDDADISFARVGSLFLIRAQFYKEDVVRGYVVNAHTLSASRLDEVTRSVIELRDGQGFVCPAGFVLASGRVVSLEGASSDMIFLSSRLAESGDVELFEFYEPVSGVSLLASWSFVEHDIDMQMLCSGFSVNDDGIAVMLFADDEPSRTHRLQVWRSPFGAVEVSSVEDAVLSRLRPDDVMSGISSLKSVAETAKKPVGSSMFFELERLVSSSLDTFWWLDDVGARSPLALLLSAVRDARSEVARVERDAASAADVLDELFSELLLLSPVSDVDKCVEMLAGCRRVIGAVRAARDLPEVDVVRVEELMVSGRGKFDELSEFLVGLLSADRSVFERIEQSLDSVEVDAKAAGSSGELAGVRGRVESSRLSLTALSEMFESVSDADPVLLSELLADLSGLLSRVSSVSSAVEARFVSMSRVEQSDAFDAAVSLLRARFVSALAAVSSVSDVDRVSSDLSASLEGVSSKFVFVDDDVMSALHAELLSRVSEVRSSLELRKNEAALRAESSGRRAIGSVLSLADRSSSVEELEGLLATDRGVEVVETAAVRLRELGLDGRANALLGELRDASAAARRRVADLVDKFDDGFVALGDVRIAPGSGLVPSVSQVEHDADTYFLGVPGSDLAVDTGIVSSVLSRGLIVSSESEFVSAAEFLAGRVLSGFGASADFAEGYRSVSSSLRSAGLSAGIHDVDARSIFDAVNALTSSRFISALASWIVLEADEVFRKSARVLFGGSLSESEVAARSFEFVPLAELVLSRVDWVSSSRLTVSVLAPVAARLAFVRAVELSASSEGCALGVDVMVSSAVSDLFSLGLDVADVFSLAFVASEFDGISAFEEFVAGYAAFKGVSVSVDADSAFEVPVVGSHARFVDGVLSSSVGELVDRTALQGVVYDSVVSSLGELAGARDEFMDRFGIEDLISRAGSSFARTELIDDVYLPAIASSLGRQFGLSGSPEGAALLLSPPGYGKTMLVRYIAELLSFRLCVVSGPALGHDTVSLDPAEAPTLAARRELERLVAALAIGDDMLVYIDDVQHLSETFLEKFLSFADSTRSVEAVLDGRAQRFDFGSARVALILAGNPYTSSGSKFRLPDMLMSRSQVFDLGSMVSSSSFAAFRFSFLEIGASLVPETASVDREDVRAFSEGRVPARVYDDAERLSSWFSLLSEVVDVILSVNAAYVRSSGVSDADRSSPPFFLQGSYRSLANIVSRLNVSMTRVEVFEVVDDFYVVEARALASSARVNELLYAEIRGVLSDEGFEELEGVRARFADRGVDHVGSIASSMAVIAELAAGSIRFASEGSSAGAVVSEPVSGTVVSDAGSADAVEVSVVTDAGEGS